MSIVLKFQKWRVLFFCCSLCWSETVFSSENFSKTKIDVWNVSLALGVGEAENPVVDSPDFELNLIPSISYYGEHFFIENLAMGYSLIETESFIFDVTSRVNLDGVYFYRQNANLLSTLGINPLFFSRREPVALERDISYMAGFSGTYSWQNFELSGRFYNDISNIHNGEESEVSLYYTNTIGLWFFSFENIIQNKSQSLANYYYKLTEQEGMGFVEPYDIGTSTTNYSLSFSARRPVTEKWNLLVNYKKTWLDRKIYESPIIKSKTTAFYFVGIEYRL